MTDLGLFAGLKGDSLGDLAKRNDKKQNNQTTNKKSKKEEKEQLPVDKTRIVCYATHRILIEDRNLSLEDIRKKLEKEYPELTKDRTDMEYDEKTGVIRVYTKAKKNGSCRKNEMRVIKNEN